jgi:NAD(P)H-hydrate epimerase
VVEAVLAVRPPGGSVLVVCGKGNNGGDGLVVARHLAALGVAVRAVVVGDPESLSGDPAANLARARAFGVPVSAMGRKLPDADVIVDALFGTGIDREVTGDPATAIRRIQAAGDEAVVVSVDLPSGLDADTGRIHGCAVDADVTVTMARPKLGLALEPGRTLAGEVWVARIGIADRAPDVADDAWLWTRAAAGERLPERPEAGHKGSFGHVLVAAGSEGKTGAAALAATGAARVGAGLVTVACPAGLNDILEVKLTEAMTVPVPDTPGRALAAGAAEPLLALAAERDVVALGPGIGTADETAKCVAAVAEGVDKPLVIDADGLNVLAGQAALLRRRRAPTVLTPHPGEAARWLGGSAGELNADRVGAARRLAADTGAVVLLKGAATVVADPDGRVVVNPTGGPALATGGTGDVLTGLVAGLLAQGVEPLEAAALAAFVHGVAAERLADDRGEAGALAGDLADAVPAALEALRARAAEVREETEMGAGLLLAFPEP